jgi:hypothetical protein
MSKSFRRTTLIAVLLFCTVPLFGAGGRVTWLKESTIIGRGSWLLAVHGVAPLPEGGLVVSDKLDYRAKKFSASGKQSAAVGGRGRGPGQFQGPGPIDVHGDRIAIADFASSRIQYFTLAFGHLETFRAPGAVSDLCFDGSGRLWVIAVTLDAQRGLFQFDKQGRLTKTLGLHNGTGDLFADVGFIAWVGNGLIAVSYFVQNKIELWDTCGSFLREFSVPGLPMKSPTRKLLGGDSRFSLSVPEGNIFRSMTSDGKGHVYLLVDDYGEAPGRELIQLSTAGQVQRRLMVTQRLVQVRAIHSGGFLAVPMERNEILRLTEMR